MSDCGAGIWSGTPDLLTPSFQKGLSVGASPTLHLGMDIILATAIRQRAKWISEGDKGRLDAEQLDVGQPTTYHTTNVFWSSAVGCNGDLAPQFGSDRANAGLRNVTSIRGSVPNMSTMVMMAAVVVPIVSL